jgi:hypothetical protein
MDLCCKNAATFVNLIGICKKKLNTSNTSEIKLKRMIQKKVN